jgi:hypothetical protein
MTTRNFVDADVNVGAEVFTADGEKLGTVKETGTNSFKVDATTMKPDYWLSCTTVEAYSPRRVITAFRKIQLDDYKLNQ